MEGEFRENWVARSDMEPEIRGDARDYLLQGSPQYFLAVEIHDIVPHLRPVTELLAGRSELSTIPEDFLHLTVKSFGNERPETRKIEDISEGHSSFEARFGHLNVFPQVVFLECLSDEIRKINQSMNKIHQAKHGADFLPHISLAYYQEKEIDSLLRYLDIHRNMDIPALEVEELILAQDSPEEASYEVIKSFNL